ncbi:MAG: DUF6913 domain-containing protein [Bacteroidia bacterium]
MGFIKNIKDFFGRKMVEPKMNSKYIKLPKFSSVQTIGILYNATDENNEKVIQQIANDYKNQGKKVYLMGFIDYKKPFKQKHIHLFNEYFWHEHLNFFNIPVFNKLGRFVTEPFDLLINLYNEDILPLQAIAAKSNANFKIGLKTDLALKYNDTIIDCGKNFSMIDASNQIVHYLNTVNNG